MSQRLLLLVALIAVCAPDARAQSPADADTATDSSRPVAVWASLELGQGHVSGVPNGINAAILRGNVSVGPWLLTYRGSEVGPLLGTGDGVREDGALIGLRTRGHRLFASAALGYEGASTYHLCDGCSMQRVNPRVGALAYDLVAHANFVFGGVSGSFSGSVGPSGVTHSALTVGFELGWFGW